MTQFRPGPDGQGWMVVGTCHGLAAVPAGQCSDFYRPFALAFALGVLVAIAAVLSSSPA